ncbi:MAG: LacI family DNA-binding transcriptional regulator [Planctomycetota bacterium]
MSTASVTMKHVAHASGVSQATVSQVLNGKATSHRIAPGTQERVRDAAARLGYRRNQSARSMRLGRFMAVGFVVTPDLQFFGFARHPRMVRGIATDCTEHNSYLRLVVLQPGDRDPDEYLRETFQELGVDGLIIGEESALSGDLEDAIRRYRVPTVWSNLWREHDAAVPDEAQGIADVLDAFLQRGHRRVAFLDVPEHKHFSWQVRHRAFEEIAARHGLTPTQVETPPDVHEATRDLTAWLRRPDRPTAVLVSGGERAQTLLWAAREAGLSVPRDLSIVALDDHHFNNVGLDLTFKRIPFMEVGQAASQLLQQKITNPERPIPSVLVPYGELKDGESLGPAPAEKSG